MAMAELERGETFAEVAEKLSDCPGKGGDLGWFPRGQMVPEFENVVFALQPGQRSGIFRTALGYHIALTIERKSAGYMDFEEARAQIATTLRAWEEHEALRRETLRLRSLAEIRRGEQPVSSMEGSGVSR